MPDQSSPEVELLRAAYTAFNRRDIDAALATMASDVTWPRAFKGGVVRGHDNIRAYWTEQWSEIDPHVEPIAFHTEGAGRILVQVHQVVRDRNGVILGDEHVGHRFTIEGGLIQAMEVCGLPVEAVVVEQIELQTNDETAVFRMTSIEKFGDQSGYHSSRFPPSWSNLTTTGSANDLPEVLARGSSTSES